MNFLKNILITASRAPLLTFALVTIPVAAQAAEEESETMGRAATIEAEGVVTSIDLKTREVSLRTDGGFMFTVVAPEAIIKLDDVKVGDRVIGSYAGAIEAEVREPTEEELAEPWKVMEEGSVSKDGDDVTLDKAQVVRAVVTIDGVSVEKGMVVVTDSRGKAHFIGDVEPDKLASLKAGQKVVIIFAESTALTLKKS